MDASRDSFTLHLAGPRSGKHGPNQLQNAPDASATLTQASATSTEPISPPLTLSTQGTPAFSRAEMRTRQPVNTTVVPVAPLAELSVQINAAVAEASRHAKGAVVAALEAGRLLAFAKEAIPFGTWEKWIEENCEVALRTAQAYMRLHKCHQGMVAHEAQRVAHLPLREAMRAIATEPTAPPSLPSYRNRDHLDEVRPIFASACRALNGVTRDLGRPLKLDRIKRLRSKLEATIAELDRMHEQGLNVRPQELRAGDK